MALIENIGFISITFVSFLLFTFFVVSLLSRGWSWKFVYPFFGILYTVIIALAYFNLCKCKDNFTFELSPAKKYCNRYLAPTGPEADFFYNTKEGQEQLDSMCCGGGFGGRPVQYHYTPESNDDWQSDRCKEEKQPDYKGHYPLGSEFTSGLTPDVL